MSEVLRGQTPLWCWFAEAQPAATAHSERGKSEEGLDQDLKLSHTYTILSEFLDLFLYHYTNVSCNT